MRQLGERLREQLRIWFLEKDYERRGETLSLSPTFPKEGRALKGEGYESWRLFRLSLDPVIPGDQFPSLKY
jgi:hypothetical protein